MRQGSKSFYIASLALPRQVRTPATALYAFCRVADDAIDHSREPLRALDDLHRRLDAVYQGDPGPELADIALTEVVHGKAPADLDAVNSRATTADCLRRVVHT